MSEIDYLEEQRHLLDTAVLNAKQLLELAKIEQEFLFDKAVPIRAVTVVLGQPASKKSWLAYDMALAAVRGEPWLGFTCKATGPALLLNYDNPTPELGRRLKRLGVLENDAIFAHSDMAGQELLILPDHIDSIQAIVRAITPRIIIVDSLRQAHHLDENSSQDMARVMRALKSLTTLGAAVVLVHHSRKLPPADTQEDRLGAIQMMRGSGEVAASADCIISVRQNTASWDKTRGWMIQEDDASVDFDVVDSGDRTQVIGV